MPIAVHVDHARRIRYAAASGVVTDDDVLDGYSAVLTDPAYDPTLDQFFDGTAIERLEVSAAALVRVAELVAQVDSAIPNGVRPRVAIVVPAEPTFSLARLYESYRRYQRSPKRYLVCRTAREALLWLGLPDAPDEGATRVHAAAASAPIRFNDVDGTEWTVAWRPARRAGLVRLDFLAEHGELRTCDVIPLENGAWAHVNEAAWRAALRTAVGA